MWRRKCALRILCVAGLALAVPAGAQVQPDTAAPDKRDNGSGKLVFVPPAIGTPASRIGAGTRSSNLGESMIFLLIPPEGGLTTLDKPTLIWRVMEDFSGVMRAQLVDTSSGGSGVERVVEGRFRKGFYALDLARSDMSLKPDRIYRWTVSADGSKSGEFFAAASGLVERVRGKDGDHGHSVNAAHAAEAGLWFDALTPLFSVSLGGQARLADATAFAEIAGSAGLPTAAYVSE